MSVAAIADYFLAEDRAARGVYHAHAAGHRQREALLGASLGRQLEQGDLDDAVDAAAGERPVVGLVGAAGRSRIVDGHVVESGMRASVADYPVAQRSLRSSIVHVIRRGRLDFGAGDARVDLVANHAPRRG